MGGKKTVTPKTVRTCPTCSQETLEDHGTTHGLLCCLGLWWICGLGCLFYRILSEEYCESCDTIRILAKGREARRLELYIDDISVYEQPLIDEAIQEEQPKMIVVEKNKSD